MKVLTAHFLALPLAALIGAAAAASVTSGIGPDSRADTPLWAGRGGPPPRGAAGGGPATSPVRALAIAGRGTAPLASPPPWGGVPGQGRGGCLPARDDLSEQDLKRVETVTRPTQDFSKAEQFEAMSAGATTTVAPIDQKVFQQFSDNLPFEDEENFKLGKALFEKLWVSTPSSTQASDGLGPLYNARACESCHPRDGRGRPPEGADATSTVYRLARPPRDEAERRLLADHRTLNFPDPVYGAQLQDSAVPGLAAEGRLKVSYREEAVPLADGEVVQLR